MRFMVLYLLFLSGRHYNNVYRAFVSFYIFRFRNVIALYDILVSRIYFMTFSLLIFSFFGG